MSQLNSPSRSGATKTSADHVIDGDLAALGDASGQDLMSIDASIDSTGVHPERAQAYRDDRPGVEARRNSLADTRRRELALMPLTLSQIYAHRVARAAAGGAAILCALGLLVILDDRFLVRLAAHFIPGFAIGVYALISVAFVLFTYTVAQWIAEQKFVACMRELVSKGPDAYRDLDQLAVGPFAVAAEKVRRVDHLSMVLPLIGIAILAPLLAFIGYIGTIALRDNYDRSAIDVFVALTGDIGPVLFAIIAGVVLAILLGRAIAREHRNGSSAEWVRWIGHWGVLIVSLVLGIVVVLAAGYAIFRMQAWGIPPAMKTRYMLALGGETVIMLSSIWYMLWWRRRERWRMGD